MVARPQCRRGHSRRPRAGRGHVARRAVRAGWRCPSRHLRPSPVAPRCASRLRRGRGCTCGADSPGSDDAPAPVGVHVCARKRHVFTNPAYQSLVPDLVPKRELRPARPSDRSASIFALVIGPALAGLGIAGSGVAVVFGLNALTYVLFALAIAFWRPPSSPRRLAVIRSPAQRRVTSTANRTLAVLDCLIACQGSYDREVKLMSSKTTGDRMCPRELTETIRA